MVSKGGDSEGKKGRRRRIRKNIGGSPYIGKLPKGCELCLEGAKLVLLVTGLCDSKCYYCPLSERRKGKDVIYANERKILRDEEILKEGKISEAEGAGITGGEPFIAFERTLHYIKFLKGEFGAEFHIHLYTTGKMATRERLKRLYEADLDEIRFHPVSRVSLERLGEALEYDWKVGVEVPAIPQEEAKLIEIARYLEEVGAHFLNINEMELSETNFKELEKRGFRLREGTIAAVDGSEETAWKVLDWCGENVRKLSVHYCPTWIKDGVQLRNRLLRRARNVAKPYQEITEEGLLYFGIIEPISCGGDLKEKRDQLEGIVRMLRRRFEVPMEMLRVNPKKGRVETAWYIVEEIAPHLKRKGLKCATVEEYPTKDRLQTLYLPL
ncbi:MAG: radical SAM protein [Candidatus Hodarchaeota archaeon]